MPRFSNSIRALASLRFMADALEMQTSLGRQKLLQQELMTSEKEINMHLDKVDQLQQLCLNSSRFIEDLQHLLSELHDITGTLNALSAGLVLDDIGLFEIKKFSLLVSGIKSLVDANTYQLVDLPNLREVIDVLDPEKQRIPHFHVYDCYSSELKQLRRQYNEFLRADQFSEPLRVLIVEVEDKVRAQLTASIRPHAPVLSKAMDELAWLDVWLAKAVLANMYKLCRPQTAHYTSYKGLFNPAVAEVLLLKGKQFQPIDIQLDEAPLIITGVNMGGKTVLLKTVALAQFLLQYGFFVPAASATIAPVHDIVICMEDEQNELKGLSSYAAEMLKINKIIHDARHNGSMLVVIDEPARTTNPQEGEAIVNALADILQHYQIKSLITTHYSGIYTTCRRLRVKGLDTALLDKNLTTHSINEYMDYSLIQVADDADAVPHEALNIAALLGVDNELLQGAATYLECKHSIITK